MCTIAIVRLHAVMTEMCSTMETGHHVRVDKGEMISEQPQVDPLLMFLNDQICDGEDHTGLPCKRLIAY